MLGKEFDPEDPFEMKAIELEGQSETQLRDMALCFAEEFVREGWGREKLLKMFQSPFYQGPYMVWKQKGDEYIKSVISEAIKMWRSNEAQTYGTPACPRLHREASRQTGSERKSAG